MPLEAPVMRIALGSWKDLLMAQCLYGEICVVASFSGCLPATASGYTRPIKQERADTRGHVAFSSLTGFTDDASIITRLADHSSIDRQGG